ncbi:uncharacterized protein LOC117913565 [Vitis riparia]|uniref:uncharacterized protein LOC117913565 n=1 Tax=Vitis riparia TaxID=96939 RepID=UPI00155A2CCC|nr:uncharacterized protein LOC117913565 [Vitis riparia]
MAWFSAAVSSGAPLIFVNIQTEQILTSEKTNSTGRELGWCRQINSGTTLQIVQGIRLWYLPGVAEVPVELIPELGETRFGMNIKRTDEGLICVFSVTRGSAADRAGLGQLWEEANKTGSLVVIARLEGRSLLPSTVSSAGLISCCDHSEIKDTLNSMMDQMESVHLQVMAWPNQTFPQAPQATGAAKLRPPSEYYSMPPL